MQRWRGVVMAVALTLFVDGAVTELIAQPSPGLPTIKGVLTSSKGDVYMMRDLSGRFVQFRVDKNTQQERLVLPEERIEVQLSSDQRAVMIKPVQ